MTRPKAFFEIVFNAYEKAHWIAYEPGQDPAIAKRMRAVMLWCCKRSGWEAQ